MRRTIARMGGLAAVALLLPLPLSGCHRWTHVRVAVSAADTGEPLAGARVRLLGRGAGVCDDPRLDNQRYRGLETGPDGAARFTMPYCDAMTAVAAHPEHLAALSGVDSCSVPPNGTLRVALALPRRAEEPPSDEASTLAVGFVRALVAGRWAEAHAVVAAAADIEIDPEAEGSPLLDRRHATPASVTAVSSTGLEVRVRILFDDGCASHLAVGVEERGGELRITRLERPE